VSAITEQLFPRTAISSAIPARSNPGTVQASLQQKGFPTDDAGTAGVVDSNYDGAPYCSHCGARAAQWCDCGPIAENE
jgi:hypothetical protein